MNTQEAIGLLTTKFPFQTYTESAAIGTNGVYVNVAETVLKNLPVGSKILDFGCGPCDKAAILQFLGFQLTGYDDLQDDWHKISDNKERILSFAEESGIDFFLAVDDKLPFEKNSFDMVMLHDVLEHLHDSPRELLNDLLDVVRPGGLIFITVPNVVNIRKRIDVLFGNTNLPKFELFYWYPSRWRGHVREYAKDDLLQLSKFLDLEIIDINGCDHLLTRLPAFVRPFYLFVTGFFPGWKDTWRLVARKKKDWRPKKNLPQDELNLILGKGMSYNYDEA